MHPQLAKLNEQFAEAGGLVESVCQGLTEEQLRLRPELNHWSIAECLVHLNLSSEAFIAQIKKACSEARQQQLLAVGPFKKDRRGAILRWCMMPPSLIKTRTTEKLEPLTIGPVEKALARFLTLQSELQKCTEEADGLDLNRIKMNSPISKFVRYNLFACFEIIIAHQLRHLWQIEQIKQRLGVGKDLKAERLAEVELAR